ncbi:MAG: DUF1080 domain-containing protein [Planctomycetota bacterium]|nr:MAG: DUF1080 domain-containing protein [Planctomycetota bacterium]
MTRHCKPRWVLLLGFGDSPEPHRTLMLASFAAAHPELQIDPHTVRCGRIPAVASHDPQRLRQIVMRAVQQRTAAQGKRIDPRRLCVHLCPTIGDGFRGAVVACLDLHDRAPGAGPPADDAGVAATSTTVSGQRAQAPPFETGNISHSADASDSVGPRQSVQTVRARAVALATAIRASIVRHPVISGVTTGIVLSALIGLAWLAPRTERPSEPNASDANGTAMTTSGDAERTNRAGDKPPMQPSNPAPPPPRFAVGQCRVYTSEPGFYVAVDGQPARFEDQRPAVTPCSVTVQQGSHTITVFRDGFADASQIVDVRDDAETSFTVGSDIHKGNSELLAAPWLNLAARRPVPLETINSSGRELDPFLTPDGLTLIFASDRPAGRGIYLATRRSVFHPFAPPQLLHRSPDTPASPSLGAEQQLLVYVVPEKARLWGLVRDNPLAPFGDKRPLRYSERLDVHWESAQVLHDGRLYWVENRNGRRTTFVAPFLPDIPDGRTDTGVARELDEAELRQIRDELVAQIERSIDLIGSADRVTRQRTVFTPRTHRKVIVRLVARIDPARRKVAEAELLLIDPQTQRAIPRSDDRPGPLAARTLYVQRDLDRAYEQVEPFALPGVHPRMTPDGLRQYGFDGRHLWRARRLSVREPFSAPETIAELQLEGFVPSAGHRQFWVSHDEQWLVYCDDPQQTADLYLVRLFYGPHWGVAPVAKPIPQKQFVEIVQRPKNTNGTTAAEAPDEPFDPMEKPPVQTPTDPRAVPLAYADHWKLFRTLLVERKYDEAEALIRAARGNPQFDRWHELLDWDADDLQAIREFWADIDRGLSTFEPGEPVRIGMTRVEFVKYADGMLIGKGRTREISKPVRDLDLPDLMALFDRSGVADSPAGRWRRAVFRFYDRNAEAPDFQRDEDAAPKLAERVARRLLQLAQAEAVRNNIAAAVQLIRRIERLAPQERLTDVPAVAEARQLLETFYERVNWRRTGNRNWIRQGTTFRADYAPASRDALLVSENEYESFELSLEYRITHDLGQGGVFFHYDGKGQPYNGGYKVHLANDAGKGVDAYSSGALFGIQAPSENAAKPKGTWNRLRIVVRDTTRLTVELNGRRVLQTTLGDPERPTKGFVALDGTVGGIEYRNVLVTELPAGS